MKSLLLSRLFAFQAFASAFPSLFCTAGDQINAQCPSRLGGGHCAAIDNVLCSRDRRRTG